MRYTKANKKIKPLIEWLYYKVRNTNISMFFAKAYN